MKINQIITEKWSQKYKRSINCSHPKGFSQRAHCAGKKKHTESVEMEMVCETCGMCQTHGNLNEIKKGAKDSNGYTRCWPGKHAEGTKKGKNGGQVRNCVPNESIAEAAGDTKFDTMMNRIKTDPWTQLNSDPDWQHEIEELVDRHIEPWLLTMERSNIPITKDNNTLNPGWRKRYEQVSTQLAQKFLTSKKFNPRDPDLVNKIRAYIDWYTDESDAVHGQLDAYATDLPLQLYLDTPTADEKIADMRANMFPNDQDEVDDDGYATRPRPEADPRRLDPGNMEEEFDPI